jgi:hypothetical protein
VGHVRATRADWLAAAARARVGRGGRGLGGLEWIGESFEGDERRKKGVAWAIRKARGLFGTPR